MHLRYFAGHGSDHGDRRRHSRAQNGTIDQQVLLTGLIQDGAKYQVTGFRRDSVSGIIVISGGSSERSSDDLSLKCKTFLSNRKNGY